MEAFLKQCLVVDDSRVIRKVACRILEKLKFEAKEADSAQAALAACREDMPDAILLDAKVAQPTDFLRHLRKEKDGKRPVVVLCTSEKDEARITAALGAGANDYLMKPFDFEALKEKLTEVGLI
jgi:two-component system, chemotaxis family, chemotaxis protein CheY